MEKSATRKNQYGIHAIETEIDKNEKMVDDGKKKKNSRRKKMCGLDSED